MQKKIFCLNLDDVKERFIIAPSNFLKYLCITSQNWQFFLIGLDTNWWNQTFICSTITKLLDWLILVIPTFKTQTQVHVFVSIYVWRKM